MCEQTVSFLIGGIVIGWQRLQALPQNERDVVVNRGAEMSARLTKSIRNLDAQAYARLKATKKAYDLTDDSRKAWADVFQKVNQQLRGPTVSSAMYDRVIQLAAR